MSLHISIIVVDCFKLGLFSMLLQIIGVIAIQLV